MIFIYIYINIQEYNNSNKAVIQDILSQFCTLLQTLPCYSFFYAAARVGFRQSMYEFAEPDVDTMYEIPLILEVLAERTLSVTVQMVPLVNGIDRATAELDFTFQTQTVTFQPLQSTQQVSFTIRSDDIPENLEGFTLYKGTEVANGTNATTTIVIVDTGGE